MTDQQQHEAGAHMDAEIHRRVFGEQITCSHGENCSDIPPYSTDLAAAMLVVERMWQRGLWCQMRNPFTRDDEYWCGFTPLGTTGWNGRPDYRASAPTLPLAICRAALAAGQS